MTVLERPVPALLPSARAQVPGTELPQQVASRALAQAAALLVWGWLVTAPLVILAGPDRFDVPALLLVVLAMAAVAGGCTAVAIRRPRALLGLTGFGLVVVAGGIAAFDVLSSYPGAPSNPAVSLMGTASLVTGLVLPRRPALAAALALALWQSWWDLGPPRAVAWTGYLEMLLTAAGAAVGAGFVARSLVRSSVQVSELVTRLLAERRADRARRAREASLAAARTDLHDTVLTTLSGIGAGWLRSTDPAALRAELERDVRLLSGADERGDGEPEDDGPVELADALNALSRASLFEHLDVRVQAATACPVPPVAADALLLATREALVNVRKHAGTEAATVTVERDEQTVRVTVRDAGRGFDPAAAGAGLGLAGIAARLAEVGGSATVDSAPGAGTAVTLALSGEAPGPAGSVPPLWSTEGPRRGALGLTVVAGISQGLSFALQAGSYADLPPQVAALVLAVSVDAVVLLTLARRPRLPGWLSALLVARIAAVLLLTGLPLPGCASMGYQHFSGGGEFVTAIVLTLLRPRREAVAAAGALVLGWAVLAAPLYRDGESCAITAVANSAIGIGLVVAAMTFVGALRRHAAIAAEVLAAEESLAAARSARQVRSAERRRLLRAVGGIVTGTLAGLADGRLNPADPQVRRLCRRDARLLRTLLTQAGDGDDLIPELFARAVGLRGSGVDLAVRGTLPPAAVHPGRRRALLAAVDTCLATVLAAGWSGEGLVTVLRAGGDVLVTVVLRAVPPGLTSGPVRMAMLDAGPTLDRAEITDGDLWVTCRVGADAPPTSGAPA